MLCIINRLNKKCSDWHLAVFVALLAATTSAYHLLILPEWLDTPSRFNPPAGESSPNLATSVMIASGRGFVEPSNGDGAQAWYPDAPVLSLFLRREIPRMTPEDVPTDFQTCVPRTDWQYRHRYLIVTIGMLWRIFGISWHVITVFRIFLYCATLVIVFFLLRLGMGRFISVFGVLLLMLNQDILSYIHNVRDFSKGPFILLVMLIIGRMIKYPIKQIELYLTALLLGLIIGLGIGFRADVLICLFPASLAVLFCRVTTKKTTIKKRLAALCLLAASFIAPASGVMGIYGGGSLFAHDILMGLVTKSDDLLRINRASYEKLYVNNDFFVAGMAAKFNERAHIVSKDPSFITDERPFLFYMLRVFPGDVITRCYASVLWIVRGDSSSGWFGIFMAACLATTLLIVAYRDLRLAWILLILFLYFGGYLSLQPERRHAFHLLFVPYWILGFLLNIFLPLFSKDTIINGTKRVYFITFCAQHGYKPFLRPILLFALPAMLAIAFPLYSARAYQSAVLKDMLRLYDSARLTPIPFIPKPMEDWVLFEPTENMPACSETIGLSELCLEYWVAEFAPRTQWRPIWLHYEKDEDAFTFFAHGLWIAPSGVKDSKNMRYFFPVIERATPSPDNKVLFSGIALPKEHADNFQGLYKVLNSKEFPLFLNLSLPGDREAFRCYQKIYGETSFALDAELARYWFWPESESSALPSVAPP